MTSENSPDRTAIAGDDDAPYDHDYGHGRMPFFMKIVWILFLAFATIYTVTYLIDSVGTEVQTR